MTETESKSDLKRSETLPSINMRTNKIYRCPPTPPPDKLARKEKSFVLDCNAVSNISLDYSRANPKLGSVIPPYNSLEDKNVSNYFNSYGVKEILEKSDLYPPEKSESIAGRPHDNFFKRGAGYKYLQKRNNKSGNGHHAETYEGHRRYMGDNNRVMISYNNMNGYRRNVPKLRSEISNFTYDPRWLERLMKSYKKGYDQDELIEHYKNTYIIGYPFWDNNYNNYHPTCKYVITVKIGEHSPDEYDGNLGINIVSKQFDTGFIKLDKNILREKKSKKKSNDDQDDEEKLFNKGQKRVFEFEDQDIRTVCIETLF
jgi:hypothetical protein